MREKLKRASNCLLSTLAGIASFVFTFAALILLREMNEKLLASLLMGMFALLIVWVASERPNSEQGRAVAALIKRLLAVRSGDFSSPAPPLVRRHIPVLADAVDTLFEQVRSNIASVQAIALYDPVTSLPNRLFFKREGEKLLAAHGPRDRAMMLFIDLDGFKEVNDNHGHAAGDRALAMVAGRLREVMRMQDSPSHDVQPVLARLAGDEFTLLFPRISGVPEAERIAEQAITALAAPLEAGDHVVQIGASVGVALYPDHAADLTGLMKAADVAMYQAKSSGRSRVCVYDEKMASAFSVRSDTEKALRKALKANEFSLVYQPQLCARTGRVLAGEALIRWDHPEHGRTLPARFIPLAEKSNLILGIGDWVMDAVAEALVRWHRAGINQRIAFNVSPRQLEDPEFFPRLRRAIARSGCSPKLIELEVTESMAMRWSDALMAELDALRREGVVIAMDDFGSGYSNLSRMKELPLDRVKLDSSLVQDVDTSEQARTIVAAVIHLIQGLGLEVVAEGVERKEQLDVLRAVRCDTFQGFAFARPMSEEEFFRWVREREGALSSAPSG